MWTLKRNLFPYTLMMFWKTSEEHMMHLCQVLGMLRKVGFELNPKKCHFLCCQVTYLGHAITPSGLKPSSDHLLAVKNFPVPKDIKSLRQFLCLSSFYQRFVHSFAKIAEPIHRLTGKDTPFKWNSDCQQSFDCLKSKLLRPQY